MAEQRFPRWCHQEVARSGQRVISPVDFPPKMIDLLSYIGMTRINGLD